MKNLQISATDAYKIYDKNNGGAYTRHGGLSPEEFEERYVGTFDDEEAFARHMMAEQLPVLYQQLVDNKMLKLFDWDTYVGNLMDKHYTSYGSQRKQVWVLEME